MLRLTPLFLCLLALAVPPSSCRRVHHVFSKVLYMRAKSRLAHIKGGVRHHASEHHSDEGTELAAMGKAKNEQHQHHQSVEEKAVQAEEGGSDGHRNGREEATASHAHDGERSGEEARLEQRRVAAAEGTHQQQQQQHHSVEVQHQQVQQQHHSAQGLQTQQQKPQQQQEQQQQQQPQHSAAEQAEEQSAHQDPPTSLPRFDLAAPMMPGFGMMAVAGPPPPPVASMVGPPPPPVASIMAGALVQGVMQVVAEKAVEHAFKHFEGSATNASHSASSARLNASTPSISLASAGADANMSAAEGSDVNASAERDVKAETEAHIAEAAGGPARTSSASGAFWRRWLSSSS